MDYANQIKSRLTMAQVVTWYGFDLSRSGYICCPFHSEKTASMKIYPDDRGFHCFGCGAHGDVITFVMKLFGLNFLSAIAKINTDFALGLAVDRPPTLLEKREVEGLKRAAEQLKQERKKIEREYLSSLKKYHKLKQYHREYAPKTMEEEWHPLFIEALEEIDFAECELYNSEKRLNEYANR